MMLGVTDGGDGCECRRCIREKDKHVMWGAIKFPLSGTKMILCGICGSKRCPKATDHRLACTDSNAPGQPGSVY